MHNKLGFDGHLGGPKRLSDNLTAEYPRHGVLGSNTKIGVGSVGFESQQFTERDVFDVAMIL